MWNLRDDYSADVLIYLFILYILFIYIFIYIFLFIIIILFMPLLFSGILILSVTL